MPTTIHGCGTRFYGKCSRNPDGSFITTEWVTLVYCPIVPLRSFRLLRNPGQDRNVIVFHSLGYGIVEKLPICWAQVGRTYLFMLAAAAWWFGVLFLFLDVLKVFEKSDNIGMMVVIMVLMAVPWVCLWRMRHNAKKEEA